MWGDPPPPSFTSRALLLSLVYLGVVIAVIAACQLANAL
jgi:hypothetical protein